MRLLGRPLQSVTHAELQALVDNAVPESPVLDYKEGLPGWTDAAKKELLADVSALANATGGVLLYGVTEKRDEQGRKTGLPESVVGVDEADVAGSAQRLEQIIRSGLDPPLSTFLVRPIPLGSRPERYVMAIGVPASLLAPHAVSFATTLPFWRRVGTGKASLSTEELRQMFSGRDTWQEEAEAFRARRCQAHDPALRSGTYDEVSLEPALLLHVLPLGRLRHWIDLRPHRDELAKLFRFGDRSFQQRFTYDGLLRTAIAEQPLKHYVQWFRFGGVEIFAGTFATSTRTSSPQPAIRIAGVTFYAVEYTHRALQTLDEVLEVPPPYAVFINALHVGGRVLELPDELRPGFPAELFYGQIAESDLLPPAVILEELPEGVDAMAQALRMVLDSLWQAGGLAHCWLIKDDGKWRGRELVGWQQAL